MDEHEELADVLEEEDLLTEIVRSIVRHPSKVRVDVARGQESTLLTIFVDPSDRGQVIGKDHKTLEAIRHLFVKSAILDGRKTHIQLGGQDVQRPNGKGRRPRGDEFVRREPVREFKRTNSE